MGQGGERKFLPQRREFTLSRESPCFSGGGFAELITSFVLLKPSMLGINDLQMYSGHEGNNSCHCGSQRVAMSEQLFRTQQLL